MSWSFSHRYTNVELGSNVRCQQLFLKLTNKPQSQRLWLKLLEAPISDLSVNCVLVEEFIRCPYLQKKESPQLHETEATATTLGAVWWQRRRYKCKDCGALQLSLERRNTCLKFEASSNIKLLKVSAVNGPSASAHIAHVLWPKSSVAVGFTFTVSIGAIHSGKRCTSQSAANASAPSWLWLRQQALHL